MTYKSVLDEFKKILEETKNNTCISDSYSDSEEETSNINPARSKIDECISKMDEVYNSIFNGLDCLFNNPDDEYESVDRNYLLINAYADASSAFDYYDSNLDEFITKPEYYYVRGNLYDMLPKANKGEYVYLHITNIKQISNTCKYYESLYLEFNESDIDDEGITIPKIKLFWDKYFSEFETTVDLNINEFDIIKNRFNELINFIRNYLNLYYNVSINLSKAENFISSTNKTSTGKKTRLSNSYSNIDSSGFSMYSIHLGNLYTLYKKALSIIESSKKFKDDYYNNSLRNIYYSEILVYYNFYNTSIEYYNWILSFRKQFNI